MPTMALLAGKRFLERIADQIALLAGSVGAAGVVTVGRVAAQAKLPAGS